MRVRFQKTYEANKYREALERMGWTLARGAAEAGYSPSYFAMMLREPRLMSERMRLRVEEVLGLAGEGRAP